MRTSLSGIVSRVDRLAQRVRVVAADEKAEFAKWIPNMSDVELECRLLLVTEQIVGPLVEFETLDALLEKYERICGAGLAADMARFLPDAYARCRWFLEHAAHGEPELVWVAAIGHRRVSKEQPYGPRLLVACPCEAIDPSSNNGTRVHTYLELVPEAFRRKVLAHHA
jgi:hypothetical protein